MATLRPRRSALRRVCVLAFLCCASVAHAGVGEYRTVEVESLRITIDSDWGLRIAPGYLPVRFDITNLGEPRVIEIVGESSRYFRSPHRAVHAGASIRRAVRLTRGDRVRLTLPVPVYADHESVRFEILEGERTIEQFNYGGYNGKAAAADASVLIVADPGGPLGSAAPGWQRDTPVSSTAIVVRGTAPSTSATPRMPSRDFILEPARVPADWLGFTSLRAVMIGAREWQQLDAAQKDGLLTWTACGGDLLLVDGDAGTLAPVVRATGDAATDRGVRAYFFGRIHFLASADVTSAGLPEVLKRAESVQDPNWALPANRSGDWGTIAGRGFRLLIPGIEGVPARAYLAILLVFSLLIGPVNYLFLWRRQRQVLLVLTAPLISLMFILLLGVYVVAGEGLGVHGRAASFTMLDEVRKQASTRASVSLYAAGMRPSGGLRFGRGTAVFPIGHDGAGSRERFDLDLTDAQRFTEGIIQARSATNFEQIGFRSARERLGFTRDAAGAMTVVNGLGTTVSALVYRVGGTVYILRAPLADGAKAVMHPGAASASVSVPTDVPLAGRYRHLLENQPEGTYLAVLERSPFWEPGVARLIEKGSFHLVIGWPQGQP